MNTCRLLEILVTKGISHWTYSLFSYGIRLNCKDKTLKQFLNHYSTFGDIIMTRFEVFVI